MPDVGAVLACLTALALAMSALAPVTDADSLDYHIGVPLDWLRAGQVTGRRGLAHGPPDGTGREPQSPRSGGGIGAIRCHPSGRRCGRRFRRTVSRRPIPRGSHPGSLVVAGCPVLVFFDSKSEADASSSGGYCRDVCVVGQVALRVRSDALRVGGGMWGFRRRLQAFISIRGFSRLCGRSTHGEPRLGHQPGRDHRNSGRHRVALAWLAALLLFYGDPLSPFFEFMKGTPDQRVMALSAHVYNAAGEHTARGYLFFCGILRFRHRREVWVRSELVLGVPVCWYDRGARRLGSRCARYRSLYWRQCLVNWRRGSSSIAISLPPWGL